MADNNYCRAHSGIDSRIKKVEESAMCHAKKLEKRTFWTVILILIPFIAGAYGYATVVNSASSDRRAGSIAEEKILDDKIHQLERKEDITSERYRQVDEKLDQIIDMQEETLDEVRKNKSDIDSLKWYHKHE